MVSTRKIHLSLISSLCLFGMILFWKPNPLTSDRRERGAPLVLATRDPSPRETKIMFVTAFVDLGSDYNVKSVDDRMRHFKKLATSGIPLLVFVSPTYESLLDMAVEQYPNIEKVVTVDWTTFETYKIIHSFSDLKLPGVRGQSKDTHQYMALQLSKPEFLYRALNHTQSSHLAWIDFNVAHVFKTNVAFQRLQAMSKRPLKAPLLAFAGIWPKITSSDFKGLLERAHWRFAGGFFIADRDSLARFNALSRDALRIFLSQTGFLVWEVNFWAWLESTFPFSFRPLVYAADHNEMLVLVPEDIYI